MRQVHVVVSDGGVPMRRDVTRSRGKCAKCRASFTLYAPGDYPHRQYQLDVVAEVAASRAIGGATAKAAAERATASATSVRRWAAWIAELAAPATLLAVAQTLAPDAPVGAGVSSVSLVSRAASVLAALEQLGVALVRGGVPLVSRTGLGRVLEWQHRVHGDVVHLVAEPRHLSPAMALGGREGGT